MPGTSGPPEIEENQRDSMHGYDVVVISCIVAVVVSLAPQLQSPALFVDSEPQMWAPRVLRTQQDAVFAEIKVQV
jgi:hypothetical protein